jgi:gas vesicle protein
MARKVQTGGTFNYYTGICALKIRKINPTNEQYLKITGRELPFTLEYEENVEGKFPIRILAEISSTDSKNTGVGTFVFPAIYVSKDVAMNKDKDKTMFVNKKGQYAYLNNDGTGEANMDWFDKEGIRPAYVGERDLSLVLSKMLALTKDDDYSIVEAQVTNFFKKFNTDKLNTLINTTPDGMSLTNGECGIVGMLSVSVNPDSGKKTQKMIIKEGYIMATEVDPEMKVSVSLYAKDRIAKSLEKDKNSGYAPKDNVSVNFRVFEDKIVEEVETVDEDDTATDLPF